MAPKTKTKKDSVAGLADLPQALLDECPFPIFRASDTGEVLLANTAARSAPGILTKDNKKMASAPAKMAALALKNNASEFSDFDSEDQIINLYFSPVPEKSYVNVYGRNVTGIRERMRQTVDYAKFPEENPNPVMRITHQGDILVANPSAREMPGLIDAGPPERVNPELSAVASQVARTGDNDSVD